MNTNKPVSRRQFLKFAGIAAGAATLAACTPQVVTQVVQETVIANQTQIVQQTQIVEITATPEPLIVTPQGRTLPADAAPLDKQVLYGEAPGERKNFDYIRDIYYAYGMNTLSEPLVHNDQNMVTVPAMADSWSAGPEARYWEFKLRADSVWSDGTPVTADDVVFSWVHAANPEMANSLMWFYAPIKGVSDVNAGGASTLISDPTTGGVRKIDDLTVRFLGNGPSADGDPCPYMLGLLSYQAACIIPKHVAELDELHWADNLPQISAGPYLCTEWVHNSSMTWDVNPTYTGPNKVGIQKLSQIIAPAGFDAMSNWLAQKEDALTSLSAAQLAVVRSNPILNPLLHFFNNFETQYITMNTFVAPFDNQKVRMALAKSFDRTILCSQVLNGTYAPGSTMLMAGFPAFSKELEAVQAFDVAAAQQLLVDAGYPGGADAAGNKLVVEITSQGGADDQRAPFFQQQWQDNLGIQVDIKKIEAGTWGAARANHEMPMYFSQYEYDYIDPSNLMTGLFHSSVSAATAHDTTPDKWGSPRHGWYNADFDALLDKADIEADVTTRLSLYQQAEAIQVNDAGQIFYDHQVIYQIWWPWVAGVPVDNTGNQVWRYLDITAFQVYISKDVDALKEQYKGII